MVLKFIFLIVFCICSDDVKSEKLIELFKWKQIEFDHPNGAVFDPSTVIFPDQLDKLQTESFDYIAYNNVPMGVTHFKDKLFITLPRRRPGIPATLNWVSTMNPSTQSPKFKAYPNFAMNKLQMHAKPGEETFISVYRTKVDACKRLWFVDTGMLEYPGNFTQVQPSSIWVLDLKTGTKLHRFEIPLSVSDDGRGLASIEVDIDDGNCDDAYGYIPDLNKRVFHVYSLQQNRIWTFRHNYFSFDPLWGNFNVAGQRFQWNDGIFSITLGKKNSNGCKPAYFHAMVSISEFSVCTSVLRNETNSLRAYHGDDFKFLGMRGPIKQSTKHDYEPKSGIIMFAEMANSGIGCWNTHKNLSENTYVTLQRDENIMIYPSDLTIDSDGHVWMMTNSMPLFIYSSLDPNEYNFRVWTQSVEKLTHNTPCDMHFNHANGGYSQV